MVAAGIAAGAGTWSTHFIAMLGYDPGLGVGYDPFLTLVSFGVAIAASCCAFALLGSSNRLPIVLGSGVLLGLGVAGMHFTGMSGVRIPGRFAWDEALVAFAITAGIALTCLSLLVFTRDLTRHPAAVAAILLTGGIAVLHFVAMGAAQAVPDPSASRPDESLDRGALAIGIAVVMLAVFAFCVLGLFAEHLRRVNQALAAQGSVLRASEERLARALDAGSDGLWDWNIATGETWFSDRWFTLLGYEPGAFESHIGTWQRLVHPEDMPRAQENLAAHFEGRSPAYECEHRLRCKDGGWGWVLARGKVVERDAQERPIRIVGTHIDIAARKAVESQVAHMARHDGLTGLTNRTHFHELLDGALAEVARAGGRCAVLCLDLDRFKAVNDTLGHLAGDKLLKQIAERLRTRIRSIDAVARLGGDEFAILIGGDPTSAFLDRVAGDLIAAVGEPVACDGQVVDVGLSIAPDHGLDEELLFRRADLALYRAKAEGRNTHRIFDPAMDEAEAGRRDIGRELRRAIAEGGLDLHFQPQVRATTGAVLGFEALVRWTHPSRGSIPPSTFIPLAEETGTIVTLGEWVLRTACSEAARWANPLKIAVNLSPRQFQQEDLPDLILGILTETGLSPARLEIEVTETAIFADMSRALSLIRRLKALGISIAMDDFGTGYSSLATLQAFPFDKIKIDRSFVGQVGSSPQAAVIVRTVLGLGRNLGIGVVAEGVETADQRDFLIAEACDELQGYFFGRPQPIERFASLVHGAAAEALPRNDARAEAALPPLERVA
ncbi:bifunctional diguanylate cyclase/phosphodiesterase [Methylobacterium iners]|uniref:Signaling protein n=1 Tax=Methylobacterium iners TaxID=418707 RepID=A0ABQ4S1Z0_9HYPH|nr:EAL domain-containing protein [Methylobacterium iners]GJD97016.1 putative signaling protein [Methylobacterium iners]